MIQIFAHNEFYIFRWWIYGMLKEKYLNADEKFEKLLYKTGMIIGVLLIAVLCIMIKVL